MEGGECRAKGEMKWPCSKRIYDMGFAIRKSAVSKAKLVINSRQDIFSQGCNFKEEIIN
jgi:hypothetical protein